MGRALASDGTSTAYPPLKYWKTADDAYRISIAVVGLLAGDISVDVKENTPIVTARKNDVS